MAVVRNYGGSWREVAIVQYVKEFCLLTLDLFWIPNWQQEGKNCSGRDNHYRSGHRIVSQSIKPKIKDSRVDHGEESDLRRKTSTPLRGEIDPDKAQTMRPSLGDFPKKE